MRRGITVLLVIGVVLLLGYWFLSPYIVDVNDTTILISPTMVQNKQSGKLEIQDIKVGTGPAVKSGDTVVMQYKGTLLNGKQFDSSYDRGTPFETKIGVGQVIKGWDMGIPGMKVGGIRKLTIPADLAYGAQAVGPIPANSTLIFQVELLQIK